MLARLQQITTLALIALACGWAVFSINSGWPVAWAWAGAGLIVAGYAAVLALEFWLLRRSYVAGDAERPRWPDLLRAWVLETTCAPRVFLWRQPFRSKAEPDSLAQSGDGRRGVVLVHGFFCNRGLWNPWMRRLRAEGVPFIALNLEPAFGSIDCYVKGLDDAVRAAEQATGLAPVIVAHSMGGLAIRAWLAKCDGGERFHRVVTIGTPHHGTLMARLGRTHNGREMRDGSPWLAALASSEKQALWKRFTCFWGRCDNIVFPTSSATLPGADNRHLAGTPHVQMVYHPAVIDEVLRLVEAPSR
ncbi:MAG: alpha/beta fold hydrolase [Caldimonas sp.]